MSRPANRHLIAFLAILLCAGALILARAMDRDLNHDEHQFLAPGALLARHGLQPYVDYPLFHLPNLVFIYAAADGPRFSLIANAKVISVIGSLIVLAILISRALSGPVFGKDRWHILFAATAAAALICDPLYLYAAGKTWNHEIPVAFAFLAFVFHVAAARRNSLRLIFLSGAFLSLAIGTRATFIPLAIPFLAVIPFISGVNARRRLAFAAAFAGGGLIGGLPSLYYLCTVPDALLFGNLEFPRVRLLDPADTRAHETAVWWRKLRYFFKEVVLYDVRKGGEITGSLSLALFYLIVVVPFAVRSVLAAWRRRTGIEPAHFPALFAALIVPFVILGCALPTRYQYQHWFALAPFTVLAGVEAVRAFPKHWIPKSKNLRIAVLSLATIIWAIGLYEYKTVEHAFTPDEWFPHKARLQAMEIREHVKAGKILTLAPAWPLEAGLDIYPQFATGPFAWRLAHLITQEKRTRFHLIAPADLDAMLAADPPAGILVGVEDDELEKPLVDWAKAHGCVKAKLRKKRTLWVPLAPGAPEGAARPK